MHKLCMDYVKKKNQYNTNQTKSIKIPLPCHPQKIPEGPPKNKETKTMGERREEVIACNKRKITEAQVICAFSKTELNIYDYKYFEKKWLPELDGIAFLARTTFDRPAGNFNSNLKVLRTHHFMSDTHSKTLPKMIWRSYILISKYISDFCLSIYSDRLLQFVK